MRILRGGCLLAGVAVLMAAPLVTVALTGTASALSAPDAMVVCTNLHGNADTLTGKLSGCPVGSTGGTGAIINFVPRGGNVTWANGSTTDYTSTATNPPTGCPAGSETFKIKGSVTSSTNAAIPVGQTVKMVVCSYPNFLLENEAGTTITF
jgi:hypothetical protein